MEILKKLRKQKGLSTKKVSEIIGYSQKSVENHENGTFLPKSDVLKRYAALYNVSISYLIDNEEKSIIISEEDYNILLQAEKTIKNIREKREAMESIRITSEHSTKIEVKGKGINIKNSFNGK